MSCFPRHLLLRPRPNSRALGILECLIFCSLVLVVLAMGVEAIRVCRSVETRSAVMTALTLAAQEELAAERAAPADSLTSSTVVLRRALPAQVGHSLSGVPAEILLRVTPIDGSLFEVTATASWIGGKDPAAVTLSTRVARIPGGRR